MKCLLPSACLGALLLSSACTQSSQKLLETANRYHANGKYKEASILYQKAILKDKKNAEAYYRQGLNLLDDHQPVEAAKYLRRAVDQNPNNTDAQVKLAEIYLSAYSSNPQRFKALLAEIRDLSAKVTQRNPHSLDSARLQAMVYLVDGNVDKALESFREANQLKPYSRDVIGWYAETLLHANRPGEAEALVRDMVSHDPTWGPGYDFLFLQYTHSNDRAKAEAVLRERLAKDPYNPIAVNNLSFFLLTENRFEEAQTIMQRVLNDKKHFPAGHEMMGDFYVRAKKYDLALAQYETGTKEDEKNAAQYQARIVAVDAVHGHADEALALARKLSAKDPKNASLNALYGSLLVDVGLRTNPKETVADLKGLVQNNPSNPALHFDLARAYFAEHDGDKSLNEALEAVRQQPKLVSARVIAARVYEDRGQHAKALEQTQMVLNVEPNNPDARLLRDRALIGLNEADQAQPELESLVKQFPQMNEVRLVLGNLYLSKRNFAQAEDQFQHVWSSNPPDPRGFLGLQTVKLAQGKRDEALAALQDFVQKNPNMPAYRYDLANVQVNAAQEAAKTDTARSNALLQQADDNYEELLKIASNSPDLYVRLGLVQRQLGQHDAALASFEQAAKIDPHNTTAFLNEGLLFDSLGKKKEAADAYSKVLALQSDNAVALNNLAFLNAENGANLDQAMTYAERAKKEAPNSPDISDTLGFVYYEKNLTGEALRIFRQNVDQYPNNATFRLHLAMALARQGDKQAAREEAQRALRNASPDEQNRIRSFVSRLG